MIINSSDMKSREECKFLALLTRTQQKASKITGAARKTFANSDRRYRKISNNRYNKILSAKRSSSNESGSASSGNENSVTQRESRQLRKISRGRLSLSSAPATDNECIDSSEEQIYKTETWKSIEDFSENYDWRLPKYVETLETWLQDLEKHPQGPKKEVLGEYKLKVEFLKKVVTTLEEEKLEMESQYISAIHADDEGSNVFPRRKPSLPSHRGSPAAGLNRRQNSPDNSSNPSKPFSVIPHGQASTADVISKEIHQKLEGRQMRNIRDELFDVGNDSGEAKPYSSQNDNNSTVPVNRGNNDLDDLLQAHHTAQEKVAEEMLSLTKSLKEQTRVAGEIVRKDTVTIERSNQLAEANSAKLQVESERLSEHTGSACRCWVWFLLAIVCVTFIAMVMVMKIFRKRKHDEL